MVAGFAIKPGTYRERRDRYALALHIPRSDAIYRRGHFSDVPESRPEWQREKLGVCRPRFCARITDDRGAESQSENTSTQL